MDNGFAAKQRLGEHLVSTGLISAAQLAEAISLQQSQPTRLGDIILAQGWVSAYKFYHALAGYYQRPFVNLLKNPPDAALFERTDIAGYLQHQLLPWRREGGLTQLALYDPTPQAIAFAKQRFGANIDFVITSKFDILWHLQHHVEGQSVEVRDALAMRMIDRLVAKQRIGELLVAKGLLSRGQLDTAIAYQKDQGGRLGDIILTQGWISAYKFYSALAEHYQRPFINLMNQPPDASLFDPASVDGYLEHSLLPWKQQQGITYFALYEPTPEAIEFAVSHSGEAIDFVITSRFDIMWYLQNHAEQYLLEYRSDHLARRMAERFAGKQRLGELLVNQHLISGEQLDEAILRQQTHGGRLGEIILSQGWVSAYKFYRALAEHYQRPFVNLMEAPPDVTLFEPADVDGYLQHSLIPWKNQGGVTYLAVYEPTPQAIEFAVSRFGEAIDFVITSRFDILWYLRNHADKYFHAQAEDYLANRMAERFAQKQRLGEHLVSKGLITPAQLDKAINLQKRWGSRLGDIILAKGWVKAYDFYTSLAAHHQRPFVNLFETPPDFSLFELDDIDGYIAHSLLPWQRKEGITYIALYDPTPQAIEFAISRFGEAIDFVITSKFDIMWQLQKHADKHFSDNAVNGLAKRMPEQSALEVFTVQQLLWIGGIGYVVLTLLTLWPIATLGAINFLIAGFLIANFGLRWVLTWVGGDKAVDLKISQHMIDVLEDHDLPTYTVLVPMYKEPDTLPILSAALRKMDYPLSKLDIKLVLEADDKETIQAAKNLGLEAIFEIIRVPPSLPKTKPKACNYALTFSRGEFVTIYDAEDKPEPDQLKKVVAAFRQAPPRTACIQARLNYFNAKENWLTKMFTLEYSLWFDFYLPALEVLRIPIPLGGTSNHFKMDVLRELNAWDPYNVTEDADLGVRITQLGYRVGVVNSTTFEEANTRFGNWIRQRSRWIKGYMQTYLVNMRNPIALYQSLGHTGFWGFQFFIGGTIVSTLLPPILYAMFFFWLFSDSNALDSIFPPIVLYVSLVNLLVGNGFFIYITGLGAFKRHYYSLILYCLTVPAYWIMMSIAAYKALWQLIHNPFYWEKTTHGLSKVKHDDLHEPTAKTQTPQS
jgi:cellulose synthase/poly-beta-1,6-N-acetylglucosamine synthase-like glycosyltransferase/uncharacterized protein (DUF1919 family)